MDTEMFRVCLFLKTKFWRQIHKQKNIIKQTSKDGYENAGVCLFLKINLWSRAWKQFSVYFLKQRFKVKCDNALSIFIFLNKILKVDTGLFFKTNFSKMDVEMLEYVHF